MMHVKHIKPIVELGQVDEAHQALDQLLALGPHNTEALKLKARLYSFEGRLGLENKIWDRIASIDPEDEETIAHMWNRQLEEREHFYFTDDLPGGARRFMAYPRRLVKMSLIGLVGCITFLLSTRLAAISAIFATPEVMLGTFGVLVMLPWVGIVVTYFRSIKSMTLSPDTVSVATRTKTHTFVWTELEKVCLARSLTSRGPLLALVLIPVAKEAPVIEIDLSEGRSDIRARTYLLRDMVRLFREPEYLRREGLSLEGRKIKAY